MKLKSLITATCLGLFGLGVVGCGGSGTSDEFIRSTLEEAQPSTGALLFNFVRPQQAFNVSGDTTRLAFDFFVDGASEPALSRIVDFATAVRIDGIDVDSTAVRITAINAAGIPLQTFSQAIQVDPLVENVVDGFSLGTAVSLAQIRLSPGTVGELGEGNSVSQVDLETNGTSQVFLFGEYDNGSVVLLGEGAMVDFVTGSAAVATVSPQGTLTGVAPGVTSLTASFDGQSITVPVVVTDDLNQIFSGLAISNEQPLSPEAGSAEGIQLALTATRSDGQQFGLTPDSTAVTYTVDSASSAFSVSPTGVLTVFAGAESGSTGTVTAQYANPDGTFVTTTANAVVP